MTEKQSAVLEFDDIQAPVLRPRPFPYRGAYFVLRIDDPAHGREMLGRLAPKVASAADQHGSADTAWVNVGLAFQGLKALGVPQDSLDSPRKLGEAFWHQRGARGGGRRLRRGGRP